MAHHRNFEMVHYRSLELEDTVIKLTELAIISNPEYKPRACGGLNLEGGLIFGVRAYIRRDFCVSI